MKNPLEILEEILLNKFIYRFSLGDTWDLFIGHHCLSAQSIEFDEENLISDLLKENYYKFNSCVDKEHIAKSTLLASNLRKVITQISLDEKKTITINFENGSPLKVLTNTEIVDWQWCLNKSGEDPYIEFDIACFWEGEIKLKEE